MYVSSKARMRRLFRNGRCLDVAIDHGVGNEPTFLNGLDDISAVVDVLVEAGPDAIQLNYGQADLLQAAGDKTRPALVLRTDLGNTYNSVRYREMWAVLQNARDPVLPAVQLDAACVVVNLFMIPDEPGIFRQCVENIARLRADCEKYGMPLMIEPLVMAPADSGKGGYAVDGDATKIVTLARVARELGADIIKADPTTNPEDFHKVVEVARCPVLVRGGSKEDLRQVLRKTEVLLRQGAKGVVYGRNVYQHVNPRKIVAALMEMIHQDASADEVGERHKLY
jgi:class I fructose-bisphosphate aldolase